MIILKVKMFKMKIMIILAIKDYPPSPNGSYFPPSFLGGLEALRRENFVLPGFLGEASEPEN